MTARLVLQGLGAPQTANLAKALFTRAGVPVGAK
jgi:hypothetical protein